MTSELAVSMDLPAWAVALAGLLCVASLGLVVWELARHRKRAVLVALTAITATILLVAAILRPVRISSRSTDVGPRVIVLVDRSASMELSGDGQKRADAASRALRDLREMHPTVRFVRLGFGQGPAAPWDGSDDSLPTDHMRSDLTSALRSLAQAADEKPSALVIISDGRLDHPSGDGPAQLEPLVEPIGAPVHAIWVASEEPADASILSVSTAGAAVAHQPVRLTITVACTGGLSCDTLPITVDELVESGSPLRLAYGAVSVQDGVGTLELPITLDRAGSRVVEIALRSPAGDSLPENDRRFLTFDVTRDRIRILHIAGRPTYDVRAMRQWLKSDASLDVVTFFILRSLASDVNSSPSELALIKFPVDELFSEHLPSFDAVVLQDFDAVPYGLAPYLPNLKRYVTDGGGLVMVGGQFGFSAGNYAGTALEEVLPVALPEGRGRVVDTTPFVPRYTAAGRDTPVMEAIRNLYGDRLPEMAGANVLDVPREGAVVLWAHPSLTTTVGEPMPLLAVGEHGNGRVIALAVDGTHRLSFSEFASDTAGRGYGALWDALLGWLMRDPRYEPARLELESQCRAGTPSTLRIHTIPGVDGELQARLVSLGRQSPERPIVLPPRDGRSTFEAELPPLDPGGYAARLRVGTGPATRHDFACERGGDEWADPRPDRAKLQAIASAAGGVAVRWDDAGTLEFPSATPVASEREVAPVLPPWLWTLAAAMALGIHWIARRRAGLA